MGSNQNQTCDSGHSRIQVLFMPSSQPLKQVEVIVKPEGNFEWVVEKVLWRRPIVANIFSHSLSCLFTFFTVSNETSIFNFDEVQFFFFSLDTRAFSVICKKPLSEPRSQRFKPMFSKNFINSYIQVFDPLRVNFCIQYEVGVQLHSFAGGYPVLLPSDFLNRLFLPH